MKDFWLNLLIVPVVLFLALAAISHAKELKVIDVVLADCGSVTCDNQCPTANAACTTAACNHCTCKHQGGIKTCFN